MDDASTDQTSSALQQRCEQTHALRIIHNDSNQGFARSCNRGAREARGTYLLLLNNDTEVTAGWFPPLLEAMESDPTIGIVGPKLIFPDGTIQHCGKVWKDTSAPLSQPHHIYYRAPGNAPFVNRSRHYTLLTGACMLVRRHEFLAIGPFDEAYENGWEDDDLCYAYAETGKRCLYCAESSVVHHQSMTLNEKIRNTEDNLASHRRRVDNNESAASTELELLQELERQLLTVKSRFQRNRERFFLKWKEQIVRDDYTYFRKDGIPFVSIVMLTFNQLDKTRACIESIRNNTPELHEIIFIDNGSTDGTVEWLRDLSTCNDKYTFIANRANRGFAAGCNQGIGAAKGEYLLLLNNDVVVTKGWLGGLLECLTRIPDSGIVGPMTNNISGIQQIPGVRYASGTELDSFAAAFRGKNRHLFIPYRRIVGFCMLFRRSLVDEIGLLDETFGTGNFEDDDYCLRAALAGYRNGIAGDVFIHHVGSASFKGNNIDYGSALADNGRLFREKWSRPVSDPEQVKHIVTLKVLEKSETLRQRGEVDDMIETLLQEGIKAIPDEPRFYHALAEGLLDAERFQEALEVLRELPEASQDVRGAILTGYAHLGLGLPVVFTDTISQALADSLFKAEGLYLQGCSAEATGDTDQAAHLWQKARTADPGLGVVYTALSGLLSADLPGEERLGMLLRGALLAPLRRETVLALQQEAHNSTGAEEALAVLKEIHRIYPQYRRGHFLLIDLLIRTERTAEALTHVEAAGTTFGFDDGMLAAGLELREQCGPLDPSPEKKKAGTAVSLCMIMKNEAKNLPRCLSSLKPIVDEIILVDTGSTDRSIEIGLLFGAKVFEHAWDNNFSAARNVSLEQATGNWILVIDADEVISRLDYDAFRTLLQVPDNNPVAYDIVTRNYTATMNVEHWRANDGSYPEEEASAGWKPSNKVRLFPNRPALRFENAIHEMVDGTIVAAGIPIVPAPVPVHHYGYLDTERQQRKGEEYYRLGLQKLRECGSTDFRALCELAVQAGEIGYYEEAVDLWQRVLKQNPDYPLAHFNLGYALLKLNRFTEARGASEQAIRLQPGYPEAINNFAICELCDGSPDRALTAVNNALERQPGHANSRIMLAVARICLGQRQEGSALMNRLAGEGIQFSGFINETVRKLAAAGKDAWIGPILEEALACGNCNEETTRILAELSVGERVKVRQ